MYHINPQWFICFGSNMLKWYRHIRSNRVFFALIYIRRHAIFSSQTLTIKSAAYRKYTHLFVILTPKIIKLLTFDCNLCFPIFNIKQMTFMCNSIDKWCKSYLSIGASEPSNVKPFYFIQTMFFFLNWPVTSVRFLPSFGRRIHKDYNKIVEKVLSVHLFFSLFTNQFSNSLER